MWLLWPEIEISSAMFYIECVSQFILDWTHRVTLGCCLHPVKTATPVNYTDGSEYVGQQSARPDLGLPQFSHRYCNDNTNIYSEKVPSSWTQTSAVGRLFNIISVPWLCISDSFNTKSLCGLDWLCGSKQMVIKMKEEYMSAAGRLRPLCNFAELRPKSIFTKSKL